VSEQSWRGAWWEPSDPDVVHHGTFYCADDGRLRLELVGGFDIDVRTPLPNGNGYAVSPASRPVPLILGVSGNHRFTLIDNGHEGSSGSGFMFGDLERQDWSPTRALRGIHLQSLDEPVFLRGQLTLERLLYWSNRSTFDLTFLREPDQQMEYHAATHDEPPVSASYEAMTIRLRIINNDFHIRRRPVANSSSMETVEWAVLDFETSDPVSYNAFDTVGKDMQDLLTLSAYAPCGAHTQSLIYESSEEHPGSARWPNEIEVMGRQVYRTQPKDDEKQVHNFVLSLADLDFPGLVPRWLGLKHRARMACSILFGLRYISEGYVGTRLLGVASAAESLHGALRPQTMRLPRPDYKALKEKLLAAIDAEPEPIRDFVRRGLDNRPTYNDRMLDLASIPDQQAVDALLTNRDRWATALKDARHDLAHANERSASGADSPSAFWLLEVTYALLCLVLLAELGLSAEVQRRALDHPNITWAAKQFKESMAETDK
jgi:ApeA-like protein/HEPN superfamily Apea-like protein